MSRDKRLPTLLVAAFIFWGTIGSGLLVAIRPREPLMLLVLGWPIVVVVVGGAVVTVLGVLGIIGWTLSPSDSRRGRGRDTDSNDEG